MDDGVRQGGVRSREEAIDDAVGTIASKLRSIYKLQPEELYISYSLVDGDVQLHVYARGVGSVAVDDVEFEERLGHLRDEHRDVLDGALWLASVGEREFVRQMNDDDFAARMRDKVRR